MKSRINEQTYYSQYGPTCPELFIKKKLNAVSGISSAKSFFLW